RCPPWTPESAKKTRDGFHAGLAFLVEQPLEEKKWDGTRATLGRELAAAPGRTEALWPRPGLLVPEQACRTLQFGLLREAISEDGVVSSEGEKPRNPPFYQRF